MTSRILIIGVTGAGRAGLPPARLARVLAADVLVAGDRQHGYFPDFAGERLHVRGGLTLVEARLRRALDAGERAVVVASGDPLCYGIATSLRRSFSPEELEVVPAPTSYQLAFAALAEPWHDAALLSAHGRPIADVVRGAMGAARAAILTDDTNTPAAIARALVAAGLAGASACAVCENLGEPGERVVRATLAEVSEQQFAPVNVFVVWPQPTPVASDGNGTKVIHHEGHEEREESKHGSHQPSRPRLTSGRSEIEAEPRPPTLSPCHPGIPDEQISTTGKLLTRREVRLLSLAELALQPGEVLWDLGAGSGAVSIEAARWQPGATVYAVERRDVMCEHIAENLRRFPAPNVRVVRGEAPAACADLPDPDAVFIGGSGGHMAGVIELVRARLRPGGRLALTLVTLENLQTARECLPGARLVQVQVSVGAPILGMLRLEAQNPIFLLTWRSET